MQSVADELSKTAGPFDVEAVSALVKLMKEFDVSEIDLQEGEQRIRLRRGQRLVSAGPPMIVQQPALQQFPPATAGSPTGVPASPTQSGKLVEIKSELVGTFYAKPCRIKMTM